jgi:hypothetical protein
MNNFDNMLYYLARLRQDRRDMDVREEELKQIINNEMDNMGIDEYVGNNFICKRQIRSRGSVSKCDLPAEIWNRYSKTSEYDHLSVKPRIPPRP